MRDARKPSRTARVTAFLVAFTAIACAACLFLPGNSGSAASGRQPDPEPVWNVGYTHGPFDEVWIAYYYRTEDVPDAASVPTGDKEDSRGNRYVFDSVDGPVSTEFGPCWEAAYRPAPGKKGSRTG